MAGQQELILVASDGGRVPVPRGEATQSSLLLRDMLDDYVHVDGAASSSGGADAIEIPLDVIDTPTLERIAAHMKYRYNHKMADIARPLKGNLEDLLDPNDKSFVAEWDESVTVSMVKASAFLNCPDLQQLASAKLASFMINKSVEEIRVMLGVQNDFSPEEEALLRKEHGMEL